MAAPTPSVKPKDDQNYWNAVFSALFIAVLLIALAVIYRVNGGIPTSIPIFDAIVLSLAAFRLNRLFVYDKITQFFRDWFLERSVYESEEGELVVERRKPRDGWRRTVSDLLSCPWCFGVWSAEVVLFGYYITDWAWPVILLLAIAGVGTFIQLIANAVGWTAEYKKQLCTANE